MIVIGFGSAMVVVALVASTGVAGARSPKAGSGFDATAAFFKGASDTVPDGVWRNVTTLADVTTSALSCFKYNNCAEMQIRQLEKWPANLPAWSADSTNTLHQHSNAHKV